MRNYSTQVLSAVDTASQTGTAFNVAQSAAASFVPSFADATATGTIKVQGSNDLPVSTPFTPTNWADIPNATSAVASGVGPAIVLAAMNFQFIRVVYTRASGGSSTILVMASFFGV